MTAVCFAILAHGNEACVSDLILSLRAFVESPRVVVFNGGRTSGYLSAIDAEVCPYSRPLEYGKLPFFHFGVMRWLHEQSRPYEFAVMLDADMLLIKPGLERYLEAAMADSSYMAINFMETRADTDWHPGQLQHRHWTREWQPIFGTENPYHCFNPGQVFRREYVDRFMRFPKRDELMARAERSRAPVLEEMILPTLAVSLDCRPRSHPGSQVPPARNLESQVSAIRWRKRHSPREIERFLHDPDAFLLHPISMSVDAPERRFARALREGERVDVDESQRAFESSVSREWAAARAPKAQLDRLARKVRARMRGGVAGWTPGSVPP